MDGEVGMDRLMMDGWMDGEKGGGLNEWRKKGGITMDELGGINE